jgi:peptidyl-prolyl cis-trans isomerase D
MRGRDARRDAQNQRADAWFSNWNEAGLCPGQDGAGAGCGPGREAAREDRVAVQMIRFLQQDNKAVKIMFAVIIGAACVIGAACISMVIYLVPGLMSDNSTGSSGTVYATVREPGVLGRLGLGASTEVKTDDVVKLSEQQLRRQHIPESMMSSMLSFLMPQAGQYLVQQAVQKQEADRLHMQVSDGDLVRELRTGPFAEYLFPNGQYVGDDRYIDFLQSAFGSEMTRSNFESEVKDDMELNRLRALVTGGVTVTDDAVRKAYLVKGMKVKFDYAAVSMAELKKTINPTDAELQSYFKENAARYATAIPETRKIEYVAFDTAKIPGGKAAVSDADVQAYYNQHAAEYKTEEQVKARHILIVVKAGADAATDAAAKAKAQDVLKQVQAGGDFAELAKKYSEDPGTKDKGGELPLMPTASLDQTFARAAMALNPGQTSGVVKSAFGYHIIQTLQKQAAGMKPLSEEKDAIEKALEQEKQGAAAQMYSMQLVADAKQNGLEKMAAAHGLHAVTTDYLAKDALIGGVSDGMAMLAQAFTTAKGSAPASVSTGDGYAVFTVLDVKAAHAPEFAEYKSHVLDDYREQKAPQLLQAETEKLGARAKQLNDLKKAAAELKVPVKTSDLVGQDAQVTDLGAMSGPGAVAFTLGKGQISEPINAGQTGVVLTVTDKQEPTADEIAKNFGATQDELVSQKRQEVYRIFLGTLMDRYEKAGSIRMSKQAAPAGVPLGR